MSGANGQRDPEPDLSDESLMPEMPVVHTARMRAAPQRGRFEWIDGALVRTVVAGVLVMLIVFAAAWARTTASAAEVAGAIETHEQRGEHPKLEKRLELVEDKLDAVRTTQILQGATLEAIHEQLKTLQRADRADRRKATP